MQTREARAGLLFLVFTLGAPRPASVQIGEQASETCVTNGSIGPEGGQGRARLLYWSTYQSHLHLRHGAKIFGFEDFGDEAVAGSAAAPAGNED